MVKKQKAYLERKHKNEVNRKAIIWVSSIFVGIVIIMAVLMILKV